MKSSSPPKLALVVFLAAACAGDGGSSAREANDVSVDTVALVDIGPTDPEAEPILDWPAGGHRFANGTIVVADFWGARVQVFDSTGRLIRTIGRRGSGPGEYEAPKWLGVCAPDTAFVGDVGQLRIDVIDDAGNVARTQRFDPDEHLDNCVPDGRAYHWEGQMAGIPRADDPPLRGELVLTRIGSTASRSAGRFDTWLYGPLRRQTSVALTSDGFVVATGETGAIQVYDGETTLVRTIETGLEPRPTTEAMYDAGLERFTEYLIGPDDRAQMRGLFRERYPKPDATPAYQVVHADPLDLLWVVASFPGEGHTALEVFDLEGNRRGSARLPVDLTIFEVGESHILGRYLDAEGVPHVALYRIARS